MLRSVYRSISCWHWLLALSILVGASVALPAQAQPSPKVTLADSLAGRRAQAPDSARLRLLLADAEALRSTDPTQARPLAEQALRLATAASQLLPQQTALLMLGRLSNSSGEFAAAARYLLHSLRLAEQRHDTLGQASACNQLGTTYKNLQQYPTALRYARQSQALLTPLADRGHPKALKSLAVAFNNSGTALLEQKQLSAARTDFLTSLRRARALGDSGVVVLALYNLGTLALMQKQGAAAYRYYQQTLAIDQASGNAQGQAESWLNLGDALALLHRAAEAEVAYQRALRLGRQAGVLPLVRVVYNGFATLYEDTGRPALALKWQKHFQELNDSLYQAESTQQVADMQAKYDTEKKEAKIKLQAAQARTQQQIIRRRNAQMVAGLVVVALLAGLAYLLYNRRRLRREIEFAEERRHLERLRSQAVLEAEENERRRIGSDLHDGVGQLLTAARLHLESLNEQLGAQPEGHQVLLANTRDLLDDSFREVRSISHNLMPNALIKLGLARAVRDFLQKASPDNRLKINLEVVGLDEGGHLEATLENVLFRVIQEVVQNIMKHAQASEVSLQIVRHETELTIVVEDNGVGFDPAALGPEAGIGLQNIESRIAYLGGRAEFDSTPGRGTTVTLEVPL